MRRFLIVLHHTFALAPLMVMANLYLLSRRAALLIGHWPQPSIDDPKYMAPDCRVCDLLYFFTMPLLLWSFVGLIAFPILTFVLRRQYERNWMILLVLLFVVGWVLLQIDPGARLMWYAD